MIHMRPSVPPISSLVEPTPMPSSEDDDLELNPKLSQHVKVPAKRKKNTLRSEGPRLQFENGLNGSGSVPAKKKHKVQTNAEASGSNPARSYSHSYSPSVPTTNTNTSPRRPLSHDTPLEPLSPPRASAKTQPQTCMPDPPIPLAASSSKSSTRNSLSQSKLTFLNDSGALTPKSRFTATPKPIPLPKKGRRRPMSNPPSPEPEESFPMPSLTAPAGSSRRGMFDRVVFQSRFSVGAPRSAPAPPSTNTVQRNKVERRALTTEVIDLTGPDGDDPGSKKDLRADSEEQIVIEVTDSDDESMVKRSRLGNSSVAGLKTGKEESTEIIEISDGEDEQQFGVAEPLFTEDEPLPISFGEDQSESFQNNTPVGERDSAQPGDVPPNSSEREEHKEHAEVRTGNSTGPEARPDSPRVEKPLEQQDNLSPTETETGEDMNETIRRTSLTSDPVELRKESGIPRSEVAQAREIKEESETGTLLERDGLGLAQEIIDLALSDGEMAEDEEDMGERSEILVDMDTQQDPPEEPGLAVEIELQPGCESVPDVQTSASSIPILPKLPAIGSQIPAKAKQNSLHLMERLRMGGNWKGKQKKIDDAMLEKDQETLHQKEMTIGEIENGNEQADEDTSTIEQVRIPEILEKDSMEWRHVRQLRKLRAMASELGRPASALSSRVRRSYDDQEVYELEYAGPSEPEIERDTRSSSPVHSSTRTSSPARSTSQVGCPSTPESSSPAGFPSLPRSPSPHPPPRAYQPVFDPDVRYARDLSSSMYDYFNSYDDDFHTGAPGHMRRVLEALS
ncbi:unnamed protein product [Mycena citricolor]|uniref:Uncharacterized protein n=1 Tax=Mycena citricolor TaxID=2018698 RepID=A0AAD2GTL1_9AGAR|nr:unnamed protein product [Mycena citricolor]